MLRTSLLKLEENIVRYISLYKYQIFNMLHINKAIQRLCIKTI
jgi:hypothetical protein